ncbi:hypothetical protein [Paenibacillus sp. GbtcB18]|nr:hypothetical protein [Paenibacillus sp. GbtcB18]
MRVSTAFAAAGALWVLAVMQCSIVQGAAPGAAQHLMPGAVAVM